MSSPSEEELGGASGGIQPGRYYGRGIPYLPINEYPGKLIAIEGTDGVGRSTQIQLLREWLEVRGYGVVETGWTRSQLMQPTIELAKSSNTLNKLTFVLLYATDFADRLEKEIIPALKAGFIVLSDRVHLHGAGARGHPRRRSSVAAGAVRLRHRAAHGVLPEGGRLDPHPARPRGARHGLLGIRDGPQARRRHLRQLPHLSEPPAARIRLDGRRVPFPRARCAGGRSIRSRTS